jgi:hypothetical protein
MNNIKDKDLPPVRSGQTIVYTFDEVRQIQREAFEAGIAQERAQWGDAMHEAWVECGCDIACDWNKIMTTYEAKRRCG